MSIESIAIDSHKLWWHTDRLNDWRNGDVVIPIYIEVSPTTRCNHNCIFCGVDFARDGIHSEVHDLDPEVACAKLDKMGELGVRSVMFAGEGEPLLHRQICDLVASAHAGGIDVSMTTNGVLGTDKWRTLLPLLTWLRFSVDAGTPEVYAKIHRCRASDASKLADSIEAALAVTELLSATIGLQFVLMRENIDDLEAFLSSFTSGNFASLDYLTIKPYSRNWFSHHKLPELCTEDDGAKVADLCYKYRNIGPEIFFRRESMRVYEKQEHRFEHCYALPFAGILSASGNFYACPVWTDERFLCGNIYEESVEDIFYDARRQEVIEFGANELDVSKCRVNCRMARINEFLEKLSHKPQHVNFI